MRIHFAAHSNHGDAILDPEYCEKNPLGGSETAMVKIAQCLRQLGADVTMTTRANQVPAGQPDVFVSLRQWNLFNAATPPGKFNYLWCQDDVDQPFLQELKDPAIAARVYGNC